MKLLVIASVVKCTLNKRIKPEIYFYCDSHGNEVDLIIGKRGTLTPVEIKSAATFSTDFIKCLDRFWASGVERVSVGFVLYNGEQQFSIRCVSVMNMPQIKDMWKTLTATRKHAEYV